MENIFSSFLAQTPKSKKFAFAQEEIRKYLSEVADLAEENGACCDPESVAARIRSILLPEDYQQEVFGVIGFSVRQKVTVCKVVFRGNVESVAVDMKVVLRTLLRSEVPTSRFVVFHTHPSGDPSPSFSDMDLTSRVRDAAKLVEIQLLDHLILAANGFKALTEYEECENCF
jgi:DNA repair protein RadC